MEGLGSVQNKISCVFETKVLDEESRKREGQSYKVVASEIVKERAKLCDIYNAKATEKLDGTCVLIANFKDQPWLWARFDRKPNKNAEKRFRKFQQDKQKGAVTTDKKFDWNMAKDFKETPGFWIPASGVEIVDGSPVPDDIGHTPGWVPISSTARQYCWHLSTVDLTQGLALVLKECEDSDALIIDCVALSDLEGHTAELIGTNSNGNPYGIGSKKQPLHLLVVHGSIQIRDPPCLDKPQIEEWFRTSGNVEGIVWHCANNTLFKVHRNHVMLPWPVAKPGLSARPVKIQVNMTKYENELDNSVFVDYDKVCGHQIESLKELVKLLFPDNVTEMGPLSGVSTDRYLDKKCLEVGIKMENGCTEEKGSGDTICDVKKNEIEDTDTTNVKT